MPLVATDGRRRSTGPFSVYATAFLTRVFTRWVKKCTIDFTLPPQSRGRTLRGLIPTFCPRAGGASLAVIAVAKPHTSMPAVAIRAPLVDQAVDTLEIDANRRLLN